MRDKSNPENRIVVVKTIDRLFYEPHNAKRCHLRAYQLYTYPLYGICPASNRNYLKHSDELLEMYPVPEHLEAMLRLDISVYKRRGHAICGNGLFADLSAAVVAMS